jgi:putative NADPH-quinone reductase
MKIVNYAGLPWNLQDVIDRILSNGIVFGFELELLASFVS